MTITIHPQARRALLLARHLAAPTLALVLTTALLLAELAYALGHQTGAAVHARSEQLARMHVALLGLAPAMSRAGFTPAEAAGAEPGDRPLPEPVAQIPVGEPARRTSVGIEPSPSAEGAAPQLATGTVRELRARCRAAGLHSRLWKSARREQLLALLA